MSDRILDHIVLPSGAGTDIWKQRVEEARRTFNTDQVIAYLNKLGVEIATTEFSPRLSRTRKVNTQHLGKTSNPALRNLTESEYQRAMLNLKLSKMRGKFDIIWGDIESLLGELIMAQTNFDGEEKPEPKG